MREVICPYDQRKAELVNSSVIYNGRSYGMAWLCRSCGAYVGTHRDSKSHAPLGRLANAELRAWKQRAHAAFDPLWRSGKMSRKDAYNQLAKALDIPSSEAHIGMFDVDQCKLVVKVFSELQSSRA